MTIESDREKILKAVWLAMTGDGACAHCVAIDLVHMAVKILDQHGMTDLANELALSRDGTHPPEGEVTH